MQRKLYTKTSLNQYWSQASFNMRCIAHNLNLEVKDCMSLIHDKQNKIRRLLTSIQRLAKPQDSFEDIKIGINCELPGLDLKTLWLTTFTMIQIAFAARSIMGLLVAQKENLDDMLVNGSEWRLSDNACTFIEAAFSAIDR